MDNGAEPQEVAASSIISQNSALGRVMSPWGFKGDSHMQQGGNFIQDLGPLEPNMKF